MEAQELELKLSQIRGQIEDAKMELAEVNEAIEVLNAIKVDPDLSYPKSTSALDEIKANAESINEIATKYRTLVDSVYIIDKTVKSIRDLEYYAEWSIKNIEYNDEKKQYDIAFSILEKLGQRIADFDCGADIETAKTIREIIPWLNAVLFAHMGEYNISLGKHSMSREQLFLYNELSHSLTPGIHSESDVNVHIDKALGFRFHDLVMEEKGKEPSVKSIKLLLGKEKEYADKVDSFSALTKQRYELLHLTAIDEFNALAWQYFNSERDYTKALSVFGLRENLKAGEIHHADYREAVDEDDFHVRFLNNESLSLTNEEFGIRACKYADAVKTGDEFEFKALVGYLKFMDLPEEKVDLLISALKRLNFESLVLLLGYALEKELPSEREERVFDLLQKQKKKELDLEKCAKALLICKTNISETFKPRFEEILGDLLRTPRSRKVITKSKTPDLHALIGEDLESFPRPWGRPAKKTRVVSWTKSSKILYVEFAIILPIVLIVSLGVLLFCLLKSELLFQYVSLVPLALIWLIIHFAIIARYGRDERGSAVYRRILLFCSWVFSALAIAYYLLPDALTVLKPLAPSAIILAIFPCLCSFFIYKDRKKGIGIAFTVIGVMAVIAAIVFFALSLAKGA